MILVSPICRSGGHSFNMSFILSGVKNQRNCSHSLSLSIDDSLEVHFLPTPPCAQFPRTHKVGNLCTMKINRY